ncbi:MAG: EAL domain-containing protein [Gammaproteobacteria bacterium]|nr:EAL domain-containing protein [Gammaproteobacteria bacterium]
MSRVLIVEQSATLRRGLERQLERYAHDVVSVDCYADATHVLKDDHAGSFRAVFVGFNDHDDDGLKLFQEVLEYPLFAGVALLVLSHEKSRRIFEWTARRPHSGMLLWDETEDLIESVRQLGRGLDGEPLQAAPLVTRVLLVDDSKTSRKKFSHILQSNGYIVTTAENSSQGLQAALTGEFDLAIVDYFMPDGNGDELCREFARHARTRDLHVAILTGSYLDELIHDSLAAGAVECMFKNEPEALILARVATLAHAAQARKAANSERRRLEGILNSVSDGVYGVDNQGIISFINPAALEILGYPKGAALVGTKAHSLFHHSHIDGKPNLPETCFLQQAYETGDNLESWETVFWNASGQAIDVECGIQPLYIDGDLQGSVVVFRDIVERKLFERELLWQANHDPLTELYNRNYFEDELRHEVARRQRSDELSALLYIDLDQFKYVNDTAGHAAGDELLVEISHLLRARLRDTDLLARLGGDEFAIIARNIDRESVAAVAESFRIVLENYNFVHGGRQFSVHGSIGVSLVDRATPDAAEVMARADIACYLAKTAGRNQVHVFEPDRDEDSVVSIDMGWSERLQTAVEQDRFVLHYQPVTATDPDKHDDPDCFEVLLRYRDDRGALVRPNAFLPTAERLGLMSRIDRWVLSDAIRSLADAQAGGNDSMLSVNLSAESIRDANLVDYVTGLIREYGADPSRLVLELAEASAIENIELARQVMIKLNRLGCRFALDDFGSGFSSFHHLKHLPVSYIKIDGHHVRSIARDASDRVVVKTINDIAKGFGKKTVAKYVESEAVLKLVTEMGVDFVQGFHVGAPLEHLPRKVPDTEPRD